LRLKLVVWDADTDISTGQTGPDDTKEQLIHRIPVPGSQNKEGNTSFLSFG